MRELAGELEREKKIEEERREVRGREREREGGNVCLMREKREKCNKKILFFFQATVRSQNSCVL